MNSLVLKILILGFPLLLSLAWFIFWVVKLLRAARKLKKQSGTKPPENNEPAAPQS